MPHDAPHFAPRAERLILLTGFDPFGGDTQNPSWLIAQALHDQRIAGHTVVAAQLPTVFDESLQRLQALLALHQPAITLCLGQAGGRSALSLERIGININDARIADNRGDQPIDTPVVRNGPAAYFSSLPVKAMLRAVLKAGIPCEVSQTAGTFVCNHVLYGLMHLLAHGAGPAGARGGFVHVPWLPEQGAPHLALRDMVRGVYTALEAAIRTQQDITLGAGATH
ncbi:MAG: pyroglutamyl-peptidase I [Gammaproteobacteria bacterium]|nr:pyroglutamyl-peptidase I [Gammaproteobacteria bacterium]MBU1350777.1 pyroglutamyl-peptidase I [Gammaproteobacteria bacterium]MBU1508626.1 pyroglutamyl-peptidase I [Gammaproteobacteria bacterium]MBU1817575.1 pyroglutamyl-peptidase I [Gammaproteobacteria bacterium]MBU2119961.1 pyroglutamyl-peptidase I [Gammaproteobacteria bacterium]